MRRLTTFFLGVACLSLVQAVFQAQDVPSAAPQQKPAAKPQPAAHDDHAGERAFEANCHRCHYAPQSLSPRITGTVVRHMRTRAVLSAREEQEILSYLNP